MPSCAPPSGCNASSTDRNLQQILETVCRQACENLGADRSLVEQMVSHAPPVKQVVSAHNQPPEYLQFIQSHPHSGFILHKDFSPDKVEVLQEPGEDPRMFHKETLSRGGIRTLCAIPLVVNRRLFGALFLYHLTPMVYSEREIAIARTFGDMASLALEKALLTASLESRLAERLAVERILRLINSSRKPHEIIQLVLQESHRVMGTARCTLVLPDPRTGEPEFYASHGVSSDFVERIRNLRTPFPLTQAYLTRPEFDEATIIQDIGAHPVLGPIHASEGHRYLVGFPLRAESENMGALYYFWTTQEGFDENRVSLGKAFADQVAIALQNARRQEQAETHVRQMRTLSSLSQEVAATASWESIFEQIHRAGREAFGAERCVVWQYTGGTDFRCIWHKGMSEDFIRHVENLPPSAETGCTRVLKSMGPVLMSDTPAGVSDPLTRDFITREGYRSSLHLPLQDDHGIFSIIVYYFDQRQRIPEEMISTAQTFANHAAVAMRKTELIHQVRQRAAHLEIVGEIVKTLSSTLEPDELFRRIALEIRRAIPYDRLVIASLNPATKARRYLYIDSDIQVRRRPLLDQEMGLWFWEALYLSKSVYNIPDIGRAGLDWVDHLIEAGVHSLLAVPILQNEECIAHLVLASRKVGAFSSDQEQLLASAAGHLGPALRNATLFEESRKRADRLKVLAEVNQQITDNLDPREVFTSIAKSVTDLLGADTCHLFLLDERREELRLHTKFGTITDDIEPGFTIPFGQGMVGYSAWANQPLISEDVLTDPRMLKKEWARKLGVHAFICRPLLHAGEVIGVINAFSLQRGHFTKEDLTLLNSLASQAAIAIQNARLHEEELRSREFFRSVVDDNADAIVVTDPDGKILLWNPAAERLFGYQKEEVLGHRLAKLIVPADVLDIWKESVGRIAHDLLRGGKASIFEGIRATKESRRVPVSVTVSPVMSENGEVRAISAMYQDLTELKKADAARDRHIERLKSLNALSQKIAASLDLNEVFDDTVDSAAAMLEVPFVGLYIWEGDRFHLRAYRGWMHPSLKGYAFRKGEGGVGCVAEKESLLYIRNVDEDPGWLFKKEAKEKGIASFLGVPLKLDKQVIGVISCLTLGEREFSRDECELSLVFANQAAIAIQNARIYSQLESSYEELRLSKEMVIRAEKLSSLGVLAAGAAHEILNPANIIGLRAQRMAEWAEEGTRERQTAEIIMKNVLRIARICDDLRRFSRKESPRMMSFDLIEVIHETLRMIGPELRMKGIAWDASLQAQPAFTIGDQHQIQQVLMCLIGNAKDAMPDGGSLQVRCSQVRQKGHGWWEVRVSDTGEGIAEENLARIFDPFFTTKPADTGTGLGLSVAHGIIENHGGRIWAENDPRTKGAIFIFRIPVSPEDSGNPENPAPR